MSNLSEQFRVDILTKIKESKQKGLKEITINRYKNFIKANKNKLTDSELKTFKELSENGYKILFLPKFKIWDPRSPKGIEIYKINW
jgi:hypothetical protein